MTRLKELQKIGCYNYHKLDQNWIITRLINSLFWFLLTTITHTHGVTKKRGNLTWITLKNLFFKQEKGTKGARNRHTKEGKKNRHLSYKSFIQSFIIERNMCWIKKRQLFKSKVKTRMFEVTIQFTIQTHDLSQDKTMTQFIQYFNLSCLTSMIRIKPCNT